MDEKKPLPVSVKREEKLLKFTEKDRDNIMNWSLNNLLGKHALALNSLLNKLELL